MNARALTLLALALVAVLMTDGAAAAPLPDKDCIGLATAHMAECLPFIHSGSNDTEKPSAKCCDGFKVLLSQNPKCLCQLASVGASFGINVTKATNLPSACGVHDHSASDCAVTPSPASHPPAPASPTVTPPTAKAPSPTTPAPNEPPTPAHNEPEVPSPAPSNTDSHSSSPSSIGISVSVLFTGLAAALFTSF